MPQTKIAVTRPSLSIRAFVHIGIEGVKAMLDLSPARILIVALARR